MNFEVMDVTLRESNYVKGNCLSSDMQRKIVQKRYKANIDLIGQEKNSCKLVPRFIASPYFAVYNNLIVPSVLHKLVGN